MKLFDEYPVLESERLLIRKMTISDAEALAALTAETAVYSSLPAFLFEYKYKDTARVIESIDTECFDKKVSIIMGIFIKSSYESNESETDFLIGIAEIYNYDEKKSKASISCRLSRSAWGRGIGTEVARMLRDYLIRDIGLNTVTAHVLKSNTASSAVFINNGFIAKYQDLYEDWGRDGLELTDKYVYKSEWEKGTQVNAVRSSLDPVQVERFVMAYKVDQDRIRAMLPAGYRSLRPVLRINAEIRDNKSLYIEFNTPVEADGRRGWLNIDSWKSSNDPGMRFERNADEVTIRTSFLQLSYSGTGAYGGCPAEQDNEGCYYLGNEVEFRPAEKIEEKEEYCCCSFRWSFNEGDAHGESDGSMLPAKFTLMQNKYDPLPFTAENAAAIKCRQVLGAYVVRFERAYD